MKSKGIVIEANKNTAKVRFIRESACGGNCASCGGCGTKPIEIIIENSLGAKAGEIVEVSSDTSGILFSAFVVYILPLAILMAVYLTVRKFFDENIATVSSIISFFLSFYPIRLYGKKIKTDVKMIAKEN